MKKIGVLFGRESIFPKALIDRINEKNVQDVTAEPILIDKVIQGEENGYAVILDRISHHVPFYRAWLKHAALNGAAVVNNPFWSSADEKLVNNELALRASIAVPKTVLLPSYEHPPHTAGESFHNLAYPFDWDAIFAYTGFPAYLKPIADGGWRNVHRVTNREELFAQHATTGQQVMLLQEEIPFEEYYRCYCIGGQQVRIMPYDPRRLHHHRYEADFKPSEALEQILIKQVTRLNQYLGYDFNTVEMAMHKGIPYAIDFFNPAPDADVHVIGEAHFEWIVETSAQFLIDKALAHKPGAENLTWGTFLQEVIQPTAPAAPEEKKAPAKKAAAAKPRPPREKAVKEKAVKEKAVKEKAPAKKKPAEGK
ncbi:hypothetical protein F0L74_13340 [Chitinophaga agrisoli]|uniref:Glutathione synthase/RimK-type ligase-like ATP-grasp enzyme n=1 Tax=Chitinophaga agrisoli TaxID=2607653 RepID=A0A5B2VXF4_9BACT|nr:hypothetical protein [Chitinophaga agrisoli]KAA2243474.1 hypothetical protein F0L74_13340 [Chitinophaga agrisoli]